MAEEFLTKQMIDEYHLFTPKLNWGSISNNPSWNFAQMYYSVEDVKKNYLVRTSLPDNQLVVESDGIQAEETIEWNLTIQPPLSIDPDATAKSVKITGNLGTIYYSFYEDDVNNSSSIVFSDMFFRQLTDGKLKFDPIFVVASRTSEDLSGFVSVAARDSDLTLRYKLANDSEVTYTGEELLITSKNQNIVITPNVSIIRPPSDGGGDDDESTFDVIYLRYDFSELNGIYYSPSFYPVFYNTTGDINIANKAEFTGTKPTTISNTSSPIDISLGKMNIEETLYLWNENNNCGSAYKTMATGSDNEVFLRNGLTYQPKPYTPKYDSSTSRYVITLSIIALSLPK